ncbi:hypothetical protein [Sphingobium abikonense]|uniref:hypothetical protein n=1 Tax=Sphingobium abikonense TaxID=86193 RepID=UPI003516A9CC
MTHATALAVLLPTVALLTVLGTRAAARRHSRPVLDLLCALAAFPVMGALIVAAEVGGAGARLLGLLAILLGSIALVAGFGLLERSSRSGEDAG